MFFKILLLDQIVPDIFLHHDFLTKHNFQAKIPELHLIFVLGHLGAFFKTMWCNFHPLLNRQLYSFFGLEWAKDVALKVA